MAADALKTDTASELTLVVGLGATGLSCARFLAARGRDFLVVDNRAQPPGLDALRREFPRAEVRLGAFEPSLFTAAGELLLSPGVSPQEPAVRAAVEAGVPVLGDIELFARSARAPVVAITGSNGKSTVTTLVAQMAREAQRRVRVGGNLGPPALELLQEEVPDLYVLELSSFQLEMTASLNPAAAVVLNVSDDHLDRHGTLEAYAAIKSRVFGTDGAMILNADDPRVAAMAVPGRQRVRYSLGVPPSATDFGLRPGPQGPVLSRGEQMLLPTAQLRLAGRHNWANALAALALGSAVGLPMEPMLAALRAFPGLPHRCQWVAEHDGVKWFNDSKGTNVGATLAALEGMPGAEVVLIAGGEGKGADFSSLREVVASRVRAVVLIGRDAPLIEQALAGTAPCVHADNMSEAVTEAQRLARPGDSVLLSPACASFDMFADYRERGERFIEAVRGWGP